VIVLFTIRAKQRKARDSNPHSPQGSRFSKAVRPSRIRLPSSERNYAVDPPGVEPGSPPRQGGALPLGDEPERRSARIGPIRARPRADSGPPGSRTPISGLRCRCRPVGPAARTIRQVEWTGRGIEPRSPGCKPGVIPLDQPPMIDPKVRPRIELGPPPYHGGVLPEHLQTGQ
jgi:hypothetical protein